MFHTFFNVTFLFSPKSCLETTFPVVFNVTPHLTLLVLSGSVKGVYYQKWKRISARIALRGFMNNTSRASGINNRLKCLGKPCWTFLPSPSSSNATSCVGIWTLHSVWARAAQMCKIFPHYKTLIQ